MTRRPRPLPRRRPPLLGRPGPLARTSDRVQAVSRLVLALLLVSAVPVATAAGARVHGDLQRAAEAQRAERSDVAATLLGDGQPAAGIYAAPGEAPASALAAWEGPAGYRQAQVPVPAGSRAGAVVHIWVDRAGTPAPAPLGGGDVAAETVSVAVLTMAGVTGVALLAHLVVVGLAHRSRMRRWSREWASVEPLWASGSR